jgi:hypothetical protein
VRSRLCGSVPRAEALRPKQNSNVEQMHKGFSDEAIVIVKRLANEDMVIYLRVKPTESAKKAEMKGGTG